MVYVEWLRVRNALRILGIILVALIVLGGIARLSFGGFESNLMSATMVPAPMIVRNGNTTTVLDPNKDLRIVFHTRGNSITWQKAAPLTHADLRELHTAPRAPITLHKYLNIKIANVHLSSLNSAVLGQTGNERITVRAIHTNRRGTSTHNHSNPDILGLLSVASFLALVFSVVLGAPLAKENDCLEVAWTKPIGRMQLAVRTFGVDIVGVLGALALLLITAIILTMMWTVPSFAVTFDKLPTLAVFLLAPIAWYALLVCGTASIREHFGMVVGCAWAVGILALPLSNLPIGRYPLGALVLVVARFVKTLDPLNYVSSSHGRLSVGVTHVNLTGSEESALILAGLIVLYLGGALLQWRRVQA